MNEFIKILKLKTFINEKCKCKIARLYVNVAQIRLMTMAEW